MDDFDFTEDPFQNAPPPLSSPQPEEEVIPNRYGVFSPPPPLPSPITSSLGSAPPSTANNLASSSGAFSSLGGPALTSIQTLTSSFGGRVMGGAFNSSPLQTTSSSQAIATTNQRRKITMVKPEPDTGDYYSSLTEPSCYAPPLSSAKPSSIGWLPAAPTPAVVSHTSSSSSPFGSQKEKEGWIVAMDVAKQTITVEHFPPAMADSLMAQASAVTMATVTNAELLQPQRYTFKCAPTKMFQARVGNRVLIVVPATSPSAGDRDGGSGGGAVASVQLRIPQPKRERERHGVIVRVVHKGMCVIECSDVVVSHVRASDARVKLEPLHYGTDANAHSSHPNEVCFDDGDANSDFSKEYMCLLWSSVPKYEVRKLEGRYGAAHVQSTMFLCGSKALVGTPVRFSLYPGTAVAKEVVFDFGTDPFTPFMPPGVLSVSDQGSYPSPSIDHLSPVDPSAAFSRSQNSQKTPSKRAEKANTTQTTPTIQVSPAPPQAPAPPTVVNGTQTDFVKLDDADMLSSSLSSTEPPSAEPAKRPPRTISWADDGTTGVPPASSESASLAAAFSPPPPLPAPVTVPEPPPKKKREPAKKTPDLGRGGTKINSRTHLSQISGAGGAGSGPFGGDAFSQSGHSPTTPLSSDMFSAVPLTQLGSWEISGVKASEFLSPIALHGATAPVAAIACSYQHMELDNHTPPLIMQETVLGLTTKGALMAKARQYLREIAVLLNTDVENAAVIADKESESSESDEVLLRLKALPVEQREPRLVLSVLDDDGEDVTECVCNLTEEIIDGSDDVSGTQQNGSSFSAKYILNILPFEMEGSCCEVRVRIALILPGYTSRRTVLPAPSSSSSSSSTGGRGGKKALEANTLPTEEDVEEPPLPLIEFTSRPFFVRPSPSSLLVKQTNKRGAAGAKSNSASVDATSAQLFTSPYASDSCSSKYWTRDYLTPADKIEQGFIDPGRANPLLDPDALLTTTSSSSSRKRGGDGSAALVDSALFDTLKEREVLLIDEASDPSLQQWVASSKQCLEHIMDTRGKVTALAYFVAAVYGGLFVNEDAFDASMAKLRFGRDTRRRQLVSSGGVGHGSSKARVVKQSANTLRIGSIPIGLCRHRALLFKYLCDQNGLMCYLVRGIFKDSPAAVTSTPSSPNSSITSPLTPSSANDANAGSRHSWCVVLTGGCGSGDLLGGKEMLLVDCTHPTAPVQLWPQRGYVCPDLPPYRQTIKITGEKNRSDEGEEAEEGDEANEGNTIEGGGGTAKKETANVDDDPDSSRYCFFSMSPHEQVPIRQEDVGRGAVAVVHRATFGGLSCALKIPHCAEDEDDLRREYAILTQFRHSNTASDFDKRTDAVTSSEAAEEEEKKKPNTLLIRGDNSHSHLYNNGIVQCLGWCDGLILEYMPFSLLGFMNSLLLRRMALKRSQIKEVLIAITRALQLVHSKGYVHRDVKTENILLYPERCGDCMRTGVVCPNCTLVAKLADFADCCSLPTRPLPTSTTSSTTTSSTTAPPLLTGPLPVVGTVPYAAPEIEAEVPFGCAADVWSLGILAVELFLMRMPMPYTGGVTGKFVISPYLPEPAAKKKSSKTSTTVDSGGQGKCNKVFVPFLDPKVVPAWGTAFTEGCLKVKMEERLSCAELLKILEKSD